MNEEYQHLTTCSLEVTPKSERSGDEASIVARHERPRPAARPASSVNSIDDVDNAIKSADARAYAQFWQYEGFCVLFVLCGYCWGNTPLLQR